MISWLSLAYDGREGGNGWSYKWPPTWPQSLPEARACGNCMENTVTRGPREMWGCGGFYGRLTLLPN